MIDDQNETVDSYGIVLPDPWTKIPLDANGQRSMLDDAVANLSSREGWTKTHARRLDVSMAHYNAALTSLNAKYAAAYVDLWPANESGVNDEGEHEPLLVTANCVIGSFTQRDLETELPLTPSTLLITASNPHVLRESLDRRVVGTTDLEPPEIVELPAGKAVRIRRHQFVRTEPGLAQGVYSETYLVSHSDAGERVCLLAFSTTNDKLAADFSPLFLRIAQTLELFRSGDPTITTTETLNW